MFEKFQERIVDLIIPNRCVSMKIELQIMRLANVGVHGIGLGTEALGGEGFSDFDNSVSLEILNVCDEILGSRTDTVLMSREKLIR